MTNFLDIVNTLSIDELRTRLAAYMAADAQYMSPLVAIEVRLNTQNSRCRYDVLLINEDGHEIPVKFRDRYSRLIYIYTLLHPQGYQRRMASANNYRALCHLYSLLYFKDSDSLLKTIDSTDTKKPGQFLNQYITQSRKAVREASPLASSFAIDRPQSHNGRLLIPFVANGGSVIIDASLCINRNFNYKLSIYVQKR